MATILTHIPVVAFSGEQCALIVCEFSPNRRPAESKKADDNLRQEFEKTNIVAAATQAKSAYLALMHIWRKQTWLSPLLTLSPRDWRIVTITEFPAAHSDSAQLALLLAMIVSQHDIGVKAIFATGRVFYDEQHQIWRVGAVEDVATKLASFYEKIKRTHYEENEQILVAIPFYQEGETRNDQQENIQEEKERLLKLAEEKKIKMTFLFLDDLATGLKTSFQHIDHYRKSYRYLALITFSAVAMFAAQQFYSPLYVNWSSSERVPLIRTQAGNYSPLCASTLGNPKIQMGDFIEFPVEVADYSIWKNFLKPQAVIVVVGEKSNVRVEPLFREEDAVNHFYTSYLLGETEEAISVTAIAQRSISINRGKLNQNLSALIKQSDQIDRLATIEGYLDAHYEKTASYRFLLVSPEHCERPNL